MTWSEANNFCQRNLSNKLVPIRRENAYQFLSDTFMKQYPYSYQNEYTRIWIGGHQLKKNGHWRWTDDNSVIANTFWAPGQPNNLVGNQHCIEMEKESYGYGWDDHYCSNIVSPELDVKDPVTSFMCGEEELFGNEFSHEKLTRATTTTRSQSTRILSTTRARLKPTTMSTIKPEPTASAKGKETTESDETSMGLTTTIGLRLPTSPDIGLSATTGVSGPNGIAKRLATAKDETNLGQFLAIGGALIVTIAILLILIFYFIRRKRKGRPNVGRNFTGDGDPIYEDDLFENSIAGGYNISFENPQYSTVGSLVHSSSWKNRRRYTKSDDKKPCDKTWSEDSGVFETSLDAANEVLAKDISDLNQYPTSTRQNQHPKQTDKQEHVINLKSNEEIDEDLKELDQLTATMERKMSEKVHIEVTDDAMKSIIDEVENSFDNQLYNAMCST